MLHTNCSKWWTNIGAKAKKCFCKNSTISVGTSLAGMILYSLHCWVKHHIDCESQLHVYHYLLSLEIKGWEVHDVYVKQKCENKSMRPCFDPCLLLDPGECLFFTTSRTRRLQQKTHFAICHKKKPWLWIRSVNICGLSRISFSKSWPFHKAMAQVKWTTTCMSRTKDGFLIKWKEHTRELTGDYMWPFCRFEKKQ